MPLGAKGTPAAVGEAKGKNSDNDGTGGGEFHA